MIIPNKLSKWSKVAVVTSSFWWPWAFPYRYQAGKKQLEQDLGVQVVEMEHTLKDPEFVYNNPKVRAQDLMNAFEDSSIDAIFSSIWWDDSIRILPYIDLDVIKNNPKIYMWYSDSTITHLICYKAWLRSYYWPAIMAWFAENCWMFEYMKESVRKTLFSNETIWEIKPNNNWWTNEFLDWAEPKNQNIPRTLNETVPWNFLQWTWTVKWELLWWCIDVFIFLFGTSIWPSAEEWKWKIMFLEFSEERPSEEYVQRILRNLWAQWVLHNLNWMIFGRAQEAYNYNEAILKIVRQEFGLDDLPIITNMDFGHTDPMFVLPIWAEMTLDMDNQKVFINESGVL